MAASYIVQVLCKEDYTEQHIVTLSDVSLAPLAPSSIRVQTRVLSLTANNLTYARLGHLLGWWDVHPLPPNLPDSLSDPSTYGRVSSWGHGEVLSSTVPEIPAGTRVFGYLPIGTLPVDKTISLTPSVSGQFMETSPHRVSLMSIYNRYTFHPDSLSTLLEDSHAKADLGWDSLMKLLFETAYLINRFVFTWDTSISILLHPSGANERWSADDANVEDAIVILFAASSKTALSLAYQLRFGRPANRRPRLVVGVTSPGSKAFVEASGWHDQVVLYDETDRLVERLEVEAETKVLMLDFGARGAAVETWRKALGEVTKKLTCIRVGGEPVPVRPEVVTAGFVKRMKESGISVNANGLRTSAMEELGEEVYFQGLEESWKRFKEDGAVKGLTLSWAEGMDAVGKGWDLICKGQAGAETGPLFVI